jgi:hypothetical protein
MASITKGILGGFSGTVGTVIGGNWNGIDYMRSLPKISGKPGTQLQLEQRTKFALVVRFMQALAGLVASTFKDSATKMTGFNKALAHTIKAAITGNFPLYQIAYSQVLVSRGSLPNDPSAKTASPAAGKIVFTWADFTGMGKATANDPSVMVVYCEELNLSVYKVNGAGRSTGTDTLTIPGFSGKSVQTWLSFLSADGQDVANSVFTGEIAVL